MISLLITLLVLALIFGLIYWVLGLIPLPPQLRNIVLAILGIIAIIYLLGIVFGYGGFHGIRIR